MWTIRATNLYADGTSVKIWEVLSLYEKGFELESLDLRGLDFWKI